MELLIRLFVWILNRTYRRTMPSPMFGVNPMDEKVLMDYELSRAMEREAQRQTEIVETFRSSATPQQGAIDYTDISWNLFTSVVESPTAFTFYTDRNIAKIVEKSRFTNPQELATLRRMVRRYVADTRLLGP